MTDKVFHLGLTGFPLGHSLSPALHTAALQVMRLKGEYGLYPAAPETADLQCLLGRVRQGELDGLNVTIPHKQTVLPLLDALEPAARAAGAVNVIFRRDHLLIGDNTDLPGFLSDLHQQFPHLAVPGQRKVLVLGAGGAARAVCAALHSAGWQLCLAARRPEQAAGLMADLRLSSAESLPLDAAGLSACGSVALIVNATPLGMAPNPQNNPWPASLPLPAGACIYDLIYNPSVTRLLQQAQQAGLSAASGAGMLVEQAALALERWTGRPAPRQVMKQVLNNWR